LNYNKLTDLQLKHKVSDRKMAKVIGMTGVGYRKMVDNKTCTVEALEKILIEFNKPIWYFFDEQDNIINEPKAECKNNCCELCREKDKQIEGLKADKEELIKDKEWLKSQIEPKKETTNEDSTQFGEGAKQNKASGF